MASSVRCDRALDIPEVVSSVVCDRDEYFSQGEFTAFWVIEHRTAR